MNLSSVRNLADLEVISQALWADWGRGLIDDTTAEAHSAAIEARKSALRLPRPRKAPKPPAARRNPVQRPDRIERRRRWTASGYLPAQIACRYTLGQQSVIAALCANASGGSLEWPIQRLANLAGVSRTVAKEALRLAAADGLITITHRPHPGARSETNIYRIIDPALMSWIARRGGGVGKAATYKSFISQTWKTHPNKSDSHPHLGCHRSSFGDRRQRKTGGR